jgi:hypothetical protein
MRVFYVYMRTCLCVNDWVIMRIIEVCTFAYVYYVCSYYVCLYINVRIRCKD